MTRATSAAARRLVRVAAGLLLLLAAAPALPAASTFAFESPASQVSEAGPNIAVRITRTGDTTVSQSVTFTTLGGTAVAPGDYTVTSQSITFAPGDTFRDISVGPVMVANPHVHVVNDTVAERNESFTLRLTTATNGGTIDAAARDNVVTIVSDEAAVAFAPGSPTFAEASGAQEILVERFGIGAITVNYAFTGGTAVNGVHYSGVPGSLQWAAGEGGAKAIPLTILDDSVAQGARTVVVSLSGAVVFAPASKTATITDDDTSVQFLSATQPATEDVAQVILKVTRTGYTGAGSFVDYATANGTAFAGTDFGIYNNLSQVTGTLFFDVGETTKDLIIGIVGDSDPEVPQTFTVTLSNPVGTMLGAITTATVTITDNDAGVGWSQMTYEAWENGGTAVLTVNRIGATNVATAVPWTAHNQTAISGTDYGVAGVTANVQGTLQWTAGDATPRTIRIPLIDNHVNGGDKTFLVHLGFPTNGVKVAGIAGNPILVTIRDDDIPAQSHVQFSATKYLVVEGAPNVQLTLQRVDAGGGFGLPVSVKYSTVAGSALAASDFTAANGVVVSWGAGDSTDRNFTIPILNNATPEAPESFKVKLSGTTPGLGIAGPSEATVWILDDDEAFPLDGVMPAGFTQAAGATKSWHVSNDPGAYEGFFSLKSDEIDDGESAGLEMTGTFNNAGNVSFRVKVSSEAGFDELQFYIDGVLKDRWSGTAVAGWQMSPSYFVSAAPHVLKWVYVKDGSASVGQDAAWIDALVTPGFTP